MVYNLIYNDWEWHRFSLTDTWNRGKQIWNGIFLQENSKFELHFTCKILYDKLTCCTLISYENERL